jgi:hypothetical protein
MAADCMKGESMPIEATAVIKKEKKIDPRRPNDKAFYPITGEQINLEAALPSGFSLHQ